MIQEHSFSGIAETGQSRPKRSEKNLTNQNRRNSRPAPFARAHEVRLRFGFCAYGPYLSEGGERIAHVLVAPTVCTAKKTSILPEIVDRCASGRGYVGSNDVSQSRSIILPPRRSSHGNDQIHLHQSRVEWSQVKSGLVSSETAGLSCRVSNCSVFVHLGISKNQLFKIQK